MKDEAVHISYPHLQEPKNNIAQKWKNLKNMLE